MIATNAAGGMNKRTFDKFRNLVYEKSGISLNDSKMSLVTSRIGKRMRTLGIHGYGDYLRYVMDDASGAELDVLLDAISTNVTSFFREADHFEFMKQVMTKWIAEGQRRFRFWSAAASTGEEPYTLAMTVLEAAAGRPDLDMKILGTDINTEVLAKCRNGVYPKDRIDKVPRHLKLKYFDKCNNGSGEPCFEVKHPLRNLMLFRRLNLSQPPFPMKGPMDMLFCRNVMIYFDNTVRRKLLAEMHRLLKPGGYLMVGHSEGLTGMITDLRIVRPSVYVKT